MLTENEVRNLLGNFQDPFLHKSLKETKGVIDVSINEEKKHVSVKLAISKTGTREQIQIQQKVVEKLNFFQFFIIS